MTTAGTPASARSLLHGGRNRPRRALLAACLAHALHDGFTDLLYVLLPVLQAQLGLSYGALAVRRGLFVGTMAALQVLWGHLAERRIGARNVLVLGTALTAAGFALASFSGSLLGLGVSLTLAGVGSSTQHPLASAAVSRAYGDKARLPLGSYNFAGDLGKAAFPLTASLLITPSEWRTALWMLAGLGFVIAVAIRWLMPVIVDRPTAPAAPTTVGSQGRSHGGQGNRR